MDFELKDLDMISSDEHSVDFTFKNISEKRESNPNVTSSSNTFSQSSQSAQTSGLPFNSISKSKYRQDSERSSLVLDDLSQQIEDLQNKLKVSYKKLLLYETENQKLIQEKNVLFFENQSLKEQNSLTSEKAKKLVSYNQELEEENEKQIHFVENTKKLMQSQTQELARLKKFHEKVSTIIKPYTQQLKEKVMTLAEQVRIKNKLIEQSELVKNDLTTSIENLKTEMTNLESHYRSEKNTLIQSYEEQIHFLSKEIVEEQQKTLDLNNEVIRLKKQCETKNYIENELIKHKRLQDENIQSINVLRLKEQELQLQTSQLKSDLASEVAQKIQLETELAQIQQILDSTRVQLSQKIDENEGLYLRLKMLEKLNTNLSLNLKD